MTERINIGDKVVTANGLIGYVRCKISATKYRIEVITASGGIRDFYLKRQNFDKITREVGNE